MYYDFTIWIPDAGKKMGKACGLLLDLVCYSTINEDNAGQYYPDFAFCHPLFSDGVRIYSDSKVSRLLDSPACFRS